MTQADPTCPHCGEPLPAAAARRAAFCPFCGAALSAPEPAADYHSVLTRFRQPRTPAEPPAPTAPAPESPPAPELPAEPPPEVPVAILAAEEEEHPAISALAALSTAEPAAPDASPYEEAPAAPLDTHEELASLATSHTPRRRPRPPQRNPTLTWIAVGGGLLLALIVVCGVYLITRHYSDSSPPVASPEPGERQHWPAADGLDLAYSPSITPSQAATLADLLKAEKVAATVELVKAGDIYQIRYQYRRPDGSPGPDPARMDRVASQLAGAEFPDSKVELHSCDENFTTVNFHTVTPLRPGSGGPGDLFPNAKGRK